MQKIFQKYYWPGNIRELKNVIERAVIIFPDKKINGKNIGKIIKLLKPKKKKIKKQDR